ncbi:hypothetical protein WN944_019113 [Citrus x changshan-huyou]|uniref:Uncharacterized protein n=1 Tax=Citrus x changshan-huyou TaxID=2935761 RepID=A0AAP0QEU2_9ROSI
MANNIGTAAMEAQEEQQVQISDDDEILDVEDDSSFDSIFSWRPRPPSSLSTEKEEEIEKNLKTYSYKYEAEDQDTLMFSMRGSDKGGRF